MNQSQECRGAASGREVIMRAAFVVLTLVVAAAAGCGQFNGDMLARGCKGGPSREAAPISAGTARVTLAIPGMT